VDDGAIEHLDGLSLPIELQTICGALDLVARQRREDVEHRVRL